MKKKFERVESYDSWDKLELAVSQRGLGNYWDGYALQYKLIADVVLVPAHIGSYRYQCTVDGDGVLLL